VKKDIITKYIIYIISAVTVLFKSIKILILQVICISIQTMEASMLSTLSKKVIMMTLLYNNVEGTTILLKIMLCSFFSKGVIVTEGKRKVLFFQIYLTLIPVEIK